MLTHTLLDDEAFEQLSCGAIDLLILRRAAPAQFASQYLFTDRPVCVLAADHELAQHGQLSLPEYLGTRHISVELDRGARQAIDSCLCGARDSVVGTPFHALAAEMLSGADLVLTVATRMTFQFAKTKNISIVAAPAELPELRFSAVWHPRLDRDPSHVWLRSVTSAVTAQAGGSPIRLRSVEHQVRFQTVSSGLAAY